MIKQKDEERDEGRNKDTENGVFMRVCLLFTLVFFMEKSQKTVYRYDE